MSDEITKPVEPVAEVATEPTVVEPTPIFNPEPSLVTSPSPLEPNSKLEPNQTTSPSPLEPNSKLEPNQTIEPASEASTSPLEVNSIPEQITIIPEPVSIPASSPEVTSEPVVAPVQSEALPRSVPEPVPTEPTPKVEPVPIAVPVTPSDPPLVTNHSSLEPNPVYSSNPKLNSAALAFISYMSRTKETLALANKKRKEYMMKRVYKVMDIFKKRKQVKNDDVEKFLHVSDDTATKYLNILVKEGKVKREGNSHSPSYKKAE